MSWLIRVRYLHSGRRASSRLTVYQKILHKFSWVSTSQNVSPEFEQTRHGRHSLPWVRRGKLWSDTMPHVKERRQVSVYEEFPWARK